jgi:hypothetical protein
MDPIFYLVPVICLIALIFGFYFVNHHWNKSQKEDENTNKDLEAAKIYDQLINDKQEQVQKTNLKKDKKQKSELDSLIEDADIIEEIEIDSDDD